MPKPTCCGVLVWRFCTPIAMCARDAIVLYADGSAAGCARRVSHTRLEAAIARGLRSTRNRVLDAAESRASRRVVALSTYTQLDSSLTARFLSYIVPSTVACKTLKSQQLRSHPCQFLHNR
ncbi:unnamed protein product [Trichogramma brassicae]|uniref:Secreted protein n=1 Tax=Trichogramma brassicae TaxID=86971 RepID=A0A6H5I6G1_9HYME|nr:unnamed protein product [Trichogramma brassicae]